MSLLKSFFLLNQVEPPDPGEMLASSITAYYPLDEASGTRADSVGSADLTVGAGSPGNTVGVLGNAVDTSGGGYSYLINSSATYAFTLEPFSLSVWIKFAAPPGGFASIFDMGAFGVIEATSAGEIQYKDSGGTARATHAVLGGTWYLVVIGYNGTNAWWSVNGAAKTVLAAATTANPTRLVIEGNAGVIHDDIGFWRATSLSDAEIAELYNSGAGLAYPFT